MSALDVYVIAEEFCWDCGHVRPLTLRCEVCASIHAAVVTPSRTDRQPPNPAAVAKGGQGPAGPDA